MLTARCMVACNCCSRSTKATILSGTLGDVVRAQLGQVSFPQRGSEEGRAAPRAGGALRVLTVVTAAGKQPQALPADEVGLGGPSLLMLLRIRAGGLTSHCLSCFQGPKFTKG